MTAARANSSAAAMLTACAGLLLAAGTVMVFSSSMTARPSELDQIYLSRQLLFVAIGACSFAGVSLIPAHAWRTLAPWLVGGTIGLLILVLVPGIGRSVNGAQRWLRWGSLSLQPSELSKLTVPLLVALVRCHSMERRLPRWREALTHLVIILPVLALIMVEPDLGTALFVGFSCLLALFLGGWPIRDFLVAGLTMLPVMGTLVVLKPYQMARLQGFVDAWTNPDRAPYQIQQSLTTLGVGGWQGTGLGRGWQKLSFLPEANTDFVFAVIGEELGLIGTLTIVLLWGGLFVAGEQMLRGLPAQSFEAVAARVLLVQLVIQAALNVAVVTSLVPPKGIPHPFLSYGGTSLVVSCLSIGMILSLTRLPAPAAMDENSDIEDSESSKFSQTGGDVVLA